MLVVVVVYAMDQKKDSIARQVLKQQRKSLILLAHLYQTEIALFSMGPSKMCTTVRPPWECKEKT